MSNANRILIVEDNPDLAMGLGNNLELEGYEVLTAGDGQTAISLTSSFKPGLIVLDLMIPEIDGFEVLKTIRSRGYSGAVLILSARGEEYDRVRGLKLGADDYVIKPFSLLELLARVEALIRRIRQPTKRSVHELRLGALRINVDSRVICKNDVPVALTPKEFQLLLALIEANGRVLTRDALLKRVWGHSGAAPTRTVDTHIAELRRKLEDDSSKPNYIITVRKAGYRVARLGELR